jgi:hypothetical protein
MLAQANKDCGYEKYGKLLEERAAVEEAKEILKDSADEC